MGPEVSIVIPCFNEETGLDYAVRHVETVCSRLGLRHEIVLVDDGSNDQTWAIITALAREFPVIQAVRFSRNFGHEAATSAGLKQSRGDQVLILDADLQDPPELLSAMRAKLAEGFDVVYGVRRSRSGESLLKKLSAMMFYRVFNWLTDNPIPHDTGDFRLMTRRAVHAFLALPESGRFFRGMVSWIGYPQTGIAYDRLARHAGSSKYNLRKLVKLSIDAIAGFSVRPLRVAVWSSLFLFLAAAVCAMVVLIQWWRGQSGGNYIFLIALMILFTGGIQTLLLGLIGEYLGRLFVESKRRPLYIIRDHITAGATNALSASDPH